MGANHGVHNRNAPLLWSRGSALYGLSGNHILQFGELSTICGRAQARNEPRAVGNTQRDRDRRRNPQA